MLGGSTIKWRQHLGMTIMAINFVANLYFACPCFLP